ncbi:hypothetical protein ABZ366_31865, partial [Streptomyces sp. NPDC005904]
MSLGDATRRPTGVTVLAYAVQMITRNARGRRRGALPHGAGGFPGVRGFGVRGLGIVLFGRRARRRWVHLILGGALAMPYVFVGSVIVGPLLNDDRFFGSLTSQLASFGAGLPLAAITALFSLTRPMSVAAVRALCGVPEGALAEGPA